MEANIVVGIDGSAPSRAALEWAADRALALGTGMVLLHAAESRLDRHDSAPEESEDSPTPLSAASRYVEARGIPVCTELTDGDPFEALVKASRSASIVVVGTHKTGFIHGRSIGSRFMGLAAMSRCPVAFIPNVSLISRRGVTLILDDSSTGRRAAILAAKEAERLAQKLTLLQSDALPAAPYDRADERAPRESDYPSGDGRRFSALITAVSSAYPLLPTRPLSTRKSLTVEAIDASMAAALVVVSHHRAGASMGSDSGRFVHDVILNLGGPVIVVPRIHSDGDVPATGVLQAV